MSPALCGAAGQVSLLYHSVGARLDLKATAAVSSSRLLAAKARRVRTTLISRVGAKATAQRKCRHSARCAVTVTGAAGRLVNRTLQVQRGV